MGSCISKCKPKKKFKEDYSNNIHDKLVMISHDPIVPEMTTMPLERPLSPAPSSSYSSFSCSTRSKFTAESSSSSSISSCSSSTISTRDRSFSNEFLKSCVKDNPHIISSKIPMMINEENLEKIVSSSTKIHSKILDQPSSVLPSQKLLKQPNQEKPVIMTSTVSSTPKKRARSNSPTPIVRTKSFRKEQNSATSIPNRGLRSSPSPSRRFKVENSKNVSSLNTINENYCRRPIMSKGSPNNYSHCSYGVKKESVRASPNRDFSINSNLSVRKMGTLSKQVSRKGTGDVACNQEMDCFMEDINNPLIALDCFIFL